MISSKLHTERGAPACDKDSDALQTLLRFGDQFSEQRAAWEYRTLHTG